MRLVRLISLLLVLLLVSGLAVAQDENVLVIGHAEATDSLDPQRGFTQSTTITLRGIYETLVTFPDDSAAEILPMLATDWTISEDGTSYTFTLNPDAVFSDGHPVTAEDVVFSVYRLKNVAGNASFLYDTASIAEVVANEDGTVTFNLTAPNPAFLAYLSNDSFAIVDSEVVIAEGGSVDGEDTAEDFLNNNSAGSGPYILESWEPQVQTTLVRNPNYYGDAPYFDRIVIQNIPEAATQKAALESGEIDIALDLTSDQIAPLTNNADIEIFSGPGNIVHFILMNGNAEQCGPSADPLVQRAVKLALDYEGYVALWGGITPASSMAYGLFTAVGPDRAPVRDLDAARAALAEAGYADGLDITLEYPTFTFQGVNMDTNAQKIQADLAEAGINVTLAPGELQVALEGYRTGAQCFGYWFWGPDVLDPIDTLSFSPGGKVSVERALWDEADASEEFRELVAQARVESDPAERVVVFERIQELLAAEAPFAAFNQPGIQTAYRAGLEGYVWHPAWLVDVALLSFAE
jgi:peptide/nickel transport system substrate-binding protein